jgi:AAA ATPase domain
MAAWATTALVGRRRELELLEAEIREAVAGQGGTVLLAGDAGIGKTRLVTELGARARAAGAQTLVGRCIDLVGAEVPYLPVAEAIRPLLAREDVRKLLGSAHELRWLLPEVVMGEEHPRPNGDPPRSQLGLLEELLALLDTVTAAEPIVLVLEDLHWADRSTLDLIAFLAHNLSETRVLLVGTYRGDELPPEHRLLQRVAQLDRVTQGVLRVAAAAGRDVPYPLLRTVAEAPEGELRQALRRAVEHGVLVGDQTAGTFRFRHALLAEAIYGRCCQASARTSKPRSRPSTTTGGAWPPSTTPAPSSRCGNDDGATPSTPSTTACACQPRRPPSCECGSAPRACAPRPSWRRSPERAATAARSPTGSNGPCNSSTRRARRRSKRQR